MNPSWLLWRVCSIWHMFFNSSLTVSINALFRSRILSLVSMRLFFMFFLILVIRWIPSMKSCSNKDWETYPLSPKSFPWIRDNKLVPVKGFLSSTFPGVSTKSKISPRSLITQCSLSPKNQPMLHCPFVASPCITRWECSRLIWHALKGVESMKEIPVHWPRHWVLKKATKGSRCLFESSTKRL